MSDGTIRFDAGVDTSGVVSAMTELSKKIVEIEGAKGEELASVQKSASARAINSMKELTDEEKALIEEKYQTLKNALDLGYISEQEFYARLKILRDEHFAEGSAGWNEYTLQILKYNNSVISKIEEDLDKTQKKLDERIEKMSGKLKDYGGLFDRNTFKQGDGSKSFLSLRDIDGDIKSLEHYNNSLVMLKERLEKFYAGDDLTEMKRAFFSEVRDLSVTDGSAFADILLESDDEKFKGYINDWAVKQNLSDAISKNLYAEEENAEKAADNIVDSLKNRFRDIPEDFFENGVSSVKNFGEGFLSELDSVIENIKAAVTEKMSSVSAQMSFSVPQATQNNSYYNIYGTESAAGTVKELEDYDTFKKMMVGD